MSGPTKIIKALAPAVSRLDMNFKDVTARVPQLTEAANLLKAGKISAAEYDALVNVYKPVTPYAFVPKPATRDEALGALVENKRPAYGGTKDMQPGERADLRLDIPAYRDSGVWVNSIHRQDAPTVYGSVSAVKNPEMIIPEGKALKVATGGPKSPFAVVRGEWDPVKEREAVERAQRFLKHPDWRQAGMDPERHSYFYDRETMEPIVGGKEALQVGPLVLVRDPKLGKKKDFKYRHGGAVNMAGGGALKAANALLRRAATSAGNKPPVAVTNDLTNINDFHTGLMDRVNERAGKMERIRDAMQFKYDKGQRVFTEDSAQKNKPPYLIKFRVPVGNVPVREPDGFKIKRDEHGNKVYTPYEPGYRVRMEIDPENWQEFDIPESAIRGDVEMRRGGAVRANTGGSIDDLIAEAVKSGAPRAPILSPEARAEQEMFKRYGQPMTEAQDTINRALPPPRKLGPVSPHVQSTQGNYERHRREVLDARKEADRAVTGELPSRLKSAAIPGAVGALAGYAAQIPGAVGDVVDLYQTFKPDSWGDAPEALQALPTTERIQEFYTPEDASPEFRAGVTGGNIAAITQAVGSVPMLMKGAATGAAKLGRKGVDAVEQFTQKVKPYDTAQEGPFYRVRPRGHEQGGYGLVGNNEAPGVTGTGTAGGSAGVAVPQRIPDEQIDALISSPDNFVLKSATDYTQKNFGVPYALPDIPPSSIVKQAPIGRVYDLAATDDPLYKSVVFDAYAKELPEVIQQSGARDYDELLERAYAQMVKETSEQFKRLPINLSYHRQGEGNYATSRDMLKDVYGNRHMYVYQGGEPLDVLREVDPTTGLSANEMFRAVHDFYGHAAHGNSFGPKGEEVAWAAHSRMFSPLARLAMSSETRGQNSFVNYTPINAELKSRVAVLDDEIDYARRRNDRATVNQLEGLKKEVFSEFQFAPNKALLLPPEFLRLDYNGGMPSYMQSLITPDPATVTEMPLTHFSNAPDLTRTDPTRYGSGAAGLEQRRIQGDPTAVRDRTYFYPGEPGAVQPEPGVGPYRYTGKASKLYDAARDPAKLKLLAREVNRTPRTAKANRGIVDQDRMMTDLERIAKEWGYEGVVNPAGRPPMAAVFQPMQVQRQRRGGQVSLDAMRMALQHKASGGVARMQKAGLVKKAVGVIDDIGKAKKEAGKMAEVLESQTPPMTTPRGGILLPRSSGMYPEDVEQTQLTRAWGRGGTPSKPKFTPRMQDLLDSRAARRKVDENIAKGADMKEWYGTEPLRQVAMQKLAKPEYERLMAHLASASQRNPVEQQNKMGSHLWHLDRTGKLKPDSVLLTNKLKKEGLPEGVTEEQLISLPEGIGSIAQTPIFERSRLIASGKTDEALPDTAKLGTFYRNLLGNTEPVTIDVHAARGPLMASKDPRWLKTQFQTKDDQGNVLETFRPREDYEAGKLKTKDALERPTFWTDAPKGSDYAGLETLWSRAAKRAGVRPAEAQAMGWYGAGDQTDLASKRELYVDGIERLIRETADKTGQAPLKVLDDFVTGKGFLFKKGGKVSVDEMRRALAERNKPKKRAARRAEGGLTSSSLIVEERKL